MELRHRVSLISRDKSDNQWDLLMGGMTSQKGIQVTVKWHHADWKRTSPYLEQPLSLSSTVSGRRALGSVSLCQSHPPSDGLGPGLEEKGAAVTQSGAATPGPRGVRQAPYGLICQRPLGGLPARPLSLCLL